jgi:hypothetical protein
MMEEKDRILDEIFSNDPRGLLNVKPKTSNVKTADERLSASFEEINEFVAKNEREPSPNPTNIAEYQLYSRLKNLREDENKSIALDPQDKYGLLKAEKKEINSIEDILNDDLLGIFDDGESQSLFEFKHTPREISRAESDFVARRKTCKNFNEFEPLFIEVQKDLSLGNRKLIDFKEKNLQSGNFYVHNGVLMYLNKVDFTDDHYVFPSGKRTQKNGRTHCVFENGTESNMLYRSVIRALYENGKIVTRNADESLETFSKNFQGVTIEDVESGYIYVLSSKSNDAKITQLKNLFKIGYSTTPVESRIKNADKEPTYLMAPVHIEAVYKTFNMNTQKFEQLIHNFFGSSCLDVDIYDNNGRRHNPKEWFLAPLKVIDEAINLLISGEIVKYQYDSDLEVIVLRE